MKTCKILGDHTTLFGCHGDTKKYHGDTKNNTKFNTEFGIIPDFLYVFSGTVPRISWGRYGKDGIWRKLDC